MECDSMIQGHISRSPNHRLIIYLNFPLLLCTILNLIFKQRKPHDASSVRGLCQYSTKTTTQIGEFDHANSNFSSKTNYELNLNRKLCLSSLTVLEWKRPHNILSDTYNRNSSFLPLLLTDQSGYLKHIGFIFYSHMLWDLSNYFKLPSKCIHEMVR